MRGNWTSGRGQARSGDKKYLTARPRQATLIMRDAIMSYRQFYKRRVQLFGKFVRSFLPVLTLAACATTDIQPMTQTSFMVATEAAPACGRTGAREVANKSAAIEVIRRGGDRFVFVDGQTGSRITGVGYNQYTGLQAYNSNEQKLVVQMTPPGHPQRGNALSARTILGANWETAVNEGIPNTCT